jgi:hypothetical protein
VELQGVHSQLRREGVALFAVTYDSVDVLRRFADRYGIEFPLLADEESAVIRRLGLLNEHVFEQHAAFGIPRIEEHWGVAYPGVFVLDRDGVVTGKRFYQSYRERETGPGILEQALGIAAAAHGPEWAIDAAAVSVRAWLDSPTWAFNQRLWLSVEVAIAPGYHVYGRPIPEGYYPLAVEVEEMRGLRVGEPAWPPPHPFRVEGLDEQFVVYEGAVRVAVPLTFAMRPGSGLQTLRATVSWQACTDRDCLPPAERRLELEVRERPLVELPPPRE